MSGRYSAFGGLRVKLAGSVTKEDMLEKFKIALDSLSSDVGLSKLEGINLYFHMTNSSGERIELVSPKYDKVDDLDVTNVTASFPFFKHGYTAITESKSQLIQHEKQVAKKLSYEQLHEQLIEEKRINNEHKARLLKLGEMLCHEFSVEKVSEVTTSIGKIVSQKTMAKYLGEQQIPDCGYVYRASLTSPGTKQVAEIRIYDKYLHLIKKITS
jgi:hypothetical protein